MKIRNIIIFSVIALLVFGSSIYISMEIKKNLVLNARKESIEKNVDTLSMFLETSQGSGEYEIANTTRWPGDDYVFNSILSYCKNGSTISWDDSSSSIKYRGNKTDKCYIYFDKYVLGVINNVNATTTYNSVTLNIDATQGSKKIKTYYYSKDNGTTYEESDSNTYTFGGLLADTSYDIKMYTQDAQGKNGEVFTKSINTNKAYINEICSTNSNLANCIKQLSNTGSKNSNIYIHNSSLENGAGDGSYRYAGSSDTTNNFVCFGYDGATCPSDSLYRIIGVFGDQVKLIKYDYATNGVLGTDGAYSTTYSDTSNKNQTSKGNNDKTNIGVYYWNNSTGTNKWSESNLNTINLNGNYLSSLGITWANKIAPTTWIVGGNTYDKIKSAPAYVTYQNEIVSPAESTTYSAKIGLIYANEFGFAAPPSAWLTKLDYYYSNDIYKNDWLYMGLWDWTITPQFDSSFSYVIGSSQLLYLGVKGWDLAVRPVFYLLENTSYNSGKGTMDDPIRISPATTDVVSVAIPSQKGTLTYTQIPDTGYYYKGKTQSPEWNNYNGGAMKMTGTTSATNAGTYTVTFSLLNGYKWSDGTTEDKEVTWTINKAPVTITQVGYSIKSNTEREYTFRASRYNESNDKYQFDFTASNCHYVSSSITSSYGNTSKFRVSKQDNINKYFVMASTPSSSNFESGFISIDDQWE